MPDSLEDEGIQREVDKILLLSNENYSQMLTNLQNAINKLNIDFPIKCTDDKATMSYYGVMTLPALIINDELVSYGEILSEEKLIVILQEKLL
ncbi:thioredoxin family protein [Brachyspira pilosicoli]|uniref:thioredoxin family protein n=1 Tax=Brachyspira pilosicoli TaxID=52584 RepID=UPI003B5AC156